MAASRTMALTLLILTMVAGVCSADGLDSISWRWSAWTPPTTTGTGGTNIPYSLLASVPVYTPPAPAAWPAPASSAASLAVSSSTGVPSNRSAVAVSGATSTPRASTPAPAPNPRATTSPTSYTLPANLPSSGVGSASPASFYGNSSNVGIQWNYGTTAASMAAATSGSGSSYNAYLNMGNGPYASSSSITSGGAMPWYLSPSVEKVYGGVPTPDQQLQFTQTVLARVESTYHNSGLDLKLTTDPTANAPHTLSVVSGTSSPTDPSAVGMTAIGQNGFSFIDKLNYAGSVNDLEWAVAHNVAHELTHAFGVDGHDPSGHYLDAAVTPWSMLTDPNATLSPGVINAIATTNFGSNLVGMGYGAQELSPSSPTAAAVPEPATYLTWAIAMMGLGGWVRSRRKAAAAC